MQDSNSKAGRRESGSGRRRRERGHAVVEASLVAPWILFLLAAVVDMGFYEYSLISTENAARVAAFYTSSSAAVANDSSGACQAALSEMNSMPNVVGVSSCGALPVIVSASSVTGVDGYPASNVSVTYQTNQMIPLPWLTGRLTVTRTAQMRVKQ
jgi:Flp pilus assembly protein TadG